MVATERKKCAPCPREREIQERGTVVTIAGMVSAGPIAEAHVTRREVPNQDCCSGSIGGTNESAASFLAGSEARMKEG